MWRILKDFFKIVRQHPWWTAMFSLFLLLGAGVSILAPYLMKVVIDRLVALESTGATREAMRGIVLGIIAWFGASVANVILYALRSFAYWTLANFDQYHQGVKDFATLLQKDISVFTRQKGGSFIDKYDNGQGARWNVSLQIIDGLLPSFSSFIVVTIFAFFFDWRLTIVLLCVIPVQLIFTWIGYRLTRKDVVESRTAWSNLYGMIGDAFQNMFAVKSYAREMYETKRVGSSLWKTIRLQFRANLRWMTIHMFDVDSIGRLLVLLAGVYFVGRGEITIGTIIMFMSFISSVLAPVQIFAGNIQMFQQEVVKFDKLRELLDADATISLHAGTHRATHVKGAFSVKDLSFSHGKKQILKKISFEVKPGEHVALVGPSGAGKSTLALLLARLYDPTRGTIALDGVDLRDWDYANVREHIAVVWQENMLFHESLGYNIRYGRVKATKRDVDRAAADATILPFIKKQEKKYETLVGERGIHLSGGEKQRVMIARAILKNAEVVILDEATSALDSITEAQVQEGIRHLIEGHTAIIIAHRLSTIRNVDRIFVVQEGRILASGTHEQLVKTCDVYSRMVSLQTHGMFDEVKEEVAN